MSGSYKNLDDESCGEWFKQPMKEGRGRSLTTSRSKLRRIKSQLDISGFFRNCVSSLPGEWW